jgi:5-methylcytosine-specific restriction endonuclease McrA
MPFTKGHKINMGKKLSKETKIKIGLGNRGKIVSNISKEKMRRARLGTIMHPNTRLAILKAHKGKPSPIKGTKRVSEIDQKRKRASWSSQRRATKRGNGGFHTIQEWEKLKELYNWTCPCCKIIEPEIKLTVDHIIPVKMGGSNDIINIQPLCKSCNSVKHTKIIKYDY